MRPSKRSLITLSSLALAVSLIACFASSDSSEPIETRTGGNSHLGYFLATPSSPGVVPIRLAAGARYDVTVWDWEDLDQHAPASLRDVSAFDTSAMRIVETRADTVTLEGVAPGSTSLNFSGVSDDARLTDRINVEVSAPSQVRFLDPCDLDTVLIAGVEGYLTRGFVDSSGVAPAQGYGLGALSLEAGSPAQLVDDLETEHASVIAVAAQTVGPLILQDTLSNTQHSVEVVAPAAITKVELVKTFEGNTAQQHPARLTLIPRVTLEGGAIACPRVSYKVRSKTPDICQIEAIGQALADEQTSTPERLRVITKSAGRCILAVAVAAGQALTSDEFEDEITINPPRPRLSPPSTGGGGGGGQRYDDGD